MTPQVRKAIAQTRRILSTWDYGRLTFFIDYKARLAGLGPIRTSEKGITDACPECRLFCSKTNIPDFWDAYRSERRKGGFACPKCGHREPWAPAAVRVMARRINEPAKTTVSV